MTTTSDAHLYTLLFSDKPEDDFLASYCPAGTTLTVGENTFTLSHMCADQAGVLGIIRHLHNLGCVLQKLEIEEEEAV